MIKFVNSQSDLKMQVTSWQQNGFKIGLVPTMGSLHEGHLSLISLARKYCDKVVTSIYINPMQFSDTEDFDSYPRRLNEDMEKLLEEKTCDLVFNPREMYRESHSTSVVPRGAALSLEGVVRPHFFAGVATIIFTPKLFLNKTSQSKKALVLVIISLLLINQGMDLYREGYMDQWKLGLPLHLCDFSTASLILYFFTRRK